jgi:hypothetical protein
LTDSPEVSEIKTAGRQARRYLACLAGGVAALLLASAAFVYTADPLQVFRRSSGAPNMYEAIEYQIPGIARHYAYDAVVTGTSTSNNFTAADLERTLGWHAVNFSVAGSTIAEQHAVLQTALATGKVRHVLWGLDPFAFRRDATEDQFPFYLYAGSGWRRVKYLWNLDAIRHGLRTMTLPAARRTSLEQWTANNVWDHQYVYGRDPVLHAWAHRDALAGQELLASPAEAVDRFMRSLILAYPQTDFRIVMLPQTVLYQKMLLDERPEEFDRGVAAGRAAVERTGFLPNARLYDFRDDPAITHDLDLFKDLVHFSGRVSGAIVESVAGERRRTGVEQFDRATERLVAAAMAYPAPGGG